MEVSRATLGGGKTKGIACSAAGEVLVTANYDPSLTESSLTQF
jgi:hypothetical protein